MGILTLAAAAVLSAVCRHNHAQAYSKKERKHTIKYDEDGQREHINLITTARKWELDPNPAPPKKSPEEGKDEEGAKKPPAGAAAAGSSKPRKSSGGGAGAPAVSGREEKPTGQRLVGQMIEMYQVDKQVYVKGTVQVRRLC